MLLSPGETLPPQRKQAAGGNNDQTNAWDNSAAGGDDDQTNDPSDAPATKGDDEWPAFPSDDDEPPVKSGDNDADASSGEDDSEEFFEAVGQVGDEFSVRGTGEGGYRFITTLDRDPYIGHSYTGKDSQDERECRCLQENDVTTTRSLMPLLSIPAAKRTLRMSKYLQKSYLSFRALT